MSSPDAISIRSSSAPASTSTPSAGAAPACHRTASGSAGLPSDGSEPLFTIRFYSYWYQTSVLGPAAVVYEDGSVAITQPGEKVTRRPADPLRPYLGGRFAPCAVAELVAEFGVLAAQDLGEPWIYDATEAKIEMTGHIVPGIPTSLYLNGYGKEDFANLSAEQNRARRDIVAWVGRIMQVTDPVSLPLDRLAVVDNIGSLASPDPRPGIAWRAPAPKESQCVTLTGRDVGTALSSVRTSFQQVKTYPYWMTTFTGTFRVGKQDRQLDVMVLPPALSC